MKSSRTGSAARELRSGAEGLVPATASAGLIHREGDSVGAAEMRTILIAMDRHRKRGGIVFRG
jgi:hypothetical protein